MIIKLYIIYTDYVRCCHWIHQIVEQVFTWLWCTLTSRIYRNLKSGLNERWTWTPSIAVLSITLGCCTTTSSATKTPSRCCRGLWQCSQITRMEHKYWGIVTWDCRRETRQRKCMNWFWVSIQIIPLLYIIWVRPYSSSIIRMWDDLLEPLISEQLKMRTPLAKFFFHMPNFFFRSCKSRGGEFFRSNPALLQNPPVRPHPRRSKEALGTGQTSAQFSH